MKKTCLFLAAAALVAVSATKLQAQPYYVAGGALTPAWAPGTPELQLTGSPLSLTTNTSTGYNEFKITGATWSDPNWPSSNCKINGDANGSNTFYFYPGTIGDGWFPLANRVGYENPGNSWGLAGDFTSPNWGDDAAALMSLAPGTNYLTVNYVIPSVGTHSFKFKTPGTWDGAVGQDFGMSSANISFATVTPNQSVEFNFDPAKGRYLINIPPVTNSVVFAVDMSSQIQLGNFHPESGYSVFVAGAFNGWPGPTTGNGLALTNYPPYNGGNNPNIYYGTNVFVGLPSSEATQYKFNQNDPAAPNGGWESTDNRTLTLLPTNGTLVLPVAFFNNAFASDYLAAPTPVFFSVDMNGAVGTDSHVFDSANDLVYVNGDFANWYKWSGQNNGNPAPAPTQYQLFEENGSGIFTNTVTLPAGTPVYFKYKYGMGIPPLTDEAVDDEAPYGNDHIRVARNTTFNPYVLAQDKFGSMYTEPYFNPGSSTNVNLGGGKLTVGPASSGIVPVSWLGRPGAQLQWSTSLTGSWQTVPGTDGSTWTTGSQSTNGFLSHTNWPANGSNVFFRLIKPN